MIDLLFSNQPYWIDLKYGFFPIFNNMDYVCKTITEFKKIFYKDIL